MGQQLRKKMGQKLRNKNVRNKKKKKYLLLHSPTPYSSTFPIRAS
jgi:hypothetical protein